MRALLGAMLFCLGGAGPALAEANAAVQPGDRFEIVRSYETQEKRNNNGSGSSHGHSTLVERVVALRDGGIEFEYSVPQDDEGRQWQFPARVFKPAVGALQLLNAAELEARVDPWLARWNWTRANCQQWGFTWTAYQVECDPQSALGIVENYSLWPEGLSAGAPFRMEGLLDVPSVELERADSDGSTYRVAGTLDPEALKLERAKAEVIISKILGRPVSQDQALEALAQVQFSGTILIRFVVSPTGLVLQRIEETELRTIEADTTVEVRQGRTTIERRQL